MEKLNDFNEISIFEASCNEIHKQILVLSILNSKSLRK